MAKLPALYSLLFALSLVLINPWGFQRGDIWTQPKLLAMHLITTCNSWVLLHQQRQGSLNIPSTWKVGLGFWALFLGVGLIATLNSPFPLRSLWGQSTLGDGWVYWVLVAAFVLSNALVLRQAPALLRSQLYGLLIGGAIVALSIFPQLLDWRIDYTATSGLVSLSNPQMLESTIWQKQMPIGLYSSRGHAAFVLAAVAVLPLLGWRWGWVRPLPAIGICLLASTSLFYTQVRGGGLALLVAAAYLLWRCLSNKERGKVQASPINLIPRPKWRGLLAFPFNLFSLTFFMSCLFAIAALLSLKNLEHFSSGRLHLWQLSLRGIAERFIWGWGFDGFGIAFPFVADWVGRHQGYLLEKVAVAHVLKLDDFTFDYQGIDGKLHAGILITNKAHNLLLDTTLSVGVLGLLCYALLWWFFLKCTVRTELIGIEAVAIAYLIYTLSWYESAQFSHLAWWALSAGLGFPTVPPHPSLAGMDLTTSLTPDRTHSTLNDNAKNQCHRSYP